jgi:hypothetical protein
MSRLILYSATASIIGGMYTMWITRNVMTIPNFKVTPDS